MAKTTAKAKAKTRAIGFPMKRTEDRRLITGASTYVDDLKLHGMLYVTFVRSIHANATSYRSKQTPRGPRLESSRC